MSGPALVAAPAGRTDPGALQPVHAYAMVANMSIVALSYATGGLSADLVQIFAVQVLLLSPRSVGLALGALILSLPFQLLAPNLARRFGHRTLMRAGYGTVLVLLVALGLLPALKPHGTAVVLIAFTLVIVLIEIAISASWGVAWHPWMRTITTAAQRPRFIARMQLTAQLLNLIMLTGFGLLAGAVVSAGDYRVLLAALGGCLVISIVLMGRIPDVAGPRSPSSPPSSPDPANPSGPDSADRGRLSALAPLRAAFTEIRGDRRLRALHLMALLDTLVMIPLLPAYAILYLGIPAGFVAVVVAVRSLAGALSGILWARVVRRYGQPAVIAAAMAAAAVLRLGWLAIPQAPIGRAGLSAQAVLLTLVVAGGVIGTGYGNATLSSWYDAASDDRSTGIFTIRDILLSTKGQLAMAGCGLLLAGLAGSRPIAGTGSYADGFKLLILLGGVAALAIVGLARRLERREASDASS